MGQIPKLIARLSSPARYRPAVMSLRACFGVIQNCRVSHPCCVVPAAVPGGRREGRQALLAGRSAFLCCARRQQPDSRTRLPAWGPRPDAAVAATCAARHAGVGVGALQAPHCLGADAHDAVAVAYRVAGGLDPGHPRMPGPVSLMLLPAQQVADSAPGHLHDGRRRWRMGIQPTILRSHKPMIRNHVLAGPAQCSPRPASACLPRLIPEQTRTRQDGLGY